MFVWYGEHDLGEVDLKRSTGMLSVEANPPANELVITGPDFSTSLTNSASFSSSVPTDRYSVEARYRYSKETREIIVTSNSQSPLRITPRLGGLYILCNRQQASFNLMKGDGQMLETGSLPITISDLPEGKCKVVIGHHGNERQETFEIKAGATNQIAIEFLYGSAVIETEPPGAAVIGQDGRSRGVTPLTISELAVGTLPVVLRLDGYEPLKLSLNIIKNQKTNLRTNLISRGYTQAIAAARQHLQSANYEAATEAISDALRAKPGDSEAAALKVEADTGMRVSQAKGLGRQGDYLAAIKELEAVLQVSPDHAQAKALLSDYGKRQQQMTAAQEKKQSDALARKAAEERLHRPGSVMETLSRQYVDADLFETKTITCKKGIKEIAEAVHEAMLKGKPSFEILKFEWPEPEVFVMDCKQKFLLGYRECLIVGGQTRNNEAQILFKVLEYEPHINLSGLLTGSSGPKVTAIHASRIPEMNASQESRLKEGVAIATERIHQGCR
jgi:tetratricopeptide (TPR) repeat protein